MNLSAAQNLSAGNATLAMKMANVLRIGDVVQLEAVIDYLSDKIREHPLLLYTDTVLLKRSSIVVSGHDREFKKIRLSLYQVLSPSLVLHPFGTPVRFGMNILLMPLKTIRFHGCLRIFEGEHADIEKDAFRLGYASE